MTYTCFQRNGKIWENLRYEYEYLSAIKLPQKLKYVKHKKVNI